MAQDSSRGDYKATIVRDSKSHKGKVIADLDRPYTYTDSKGQHIIRQLRISRERLKEYRSDGKGSYFLQEKDLVHLINMNHDALATRSEQPKLELIEEKVGAILGESSKNEEDSDYKLGS